MQPNPPFVLSGRYEVEEEVGRGGFARVFRGKGWILPYKRLTGLEHILDTLLKWFCKVRPEHFAQRMA